MAEELVAEVQPASAEERASSGEPAEEQPEPGEPAEGSAPVTGGETAPGWSRDPQPPPHEVEYDAVRLLEPETVETEWGPAEGQPGQWKLTPRGEGGRPFLVHQDDVGRYFAVRPAP